MATVYLAHDVRHDRSVALKVLRPELAAVIGAERFLAEIKTTANLQHPHILPLHDSGEAAGTVFYVMPFVEGESLRDRLIREHQLPVDEALRIATEVAGALDYAHRHGVVHRDIKPENILLHEGQALVADFGIALAVSRSDGGTRMTETGMSLGTPHYMSPEQAMGEREISPGADIYALGCVLYEMLAGEPPFTGATAQAIVARVVTEDPRSLTGQRKTVPRHVDAVVATALQKLPADRFASASDFAAALANPGYGSEAAAGGEGARRSPRARWLTRVFAATTVVAGLLAAWGWVRAERAGRHSTTWQYVSMGDSATVVTTLPSFALSPDGTELAFVDDRPNGLLWLKRQGQLAPTPLRGTEGATSPVFSPDGRWVAFVAGSSLKKVRVDGSVAVTLADSVDRGFGGAAWLDDGTLVYTTVHQNELRQVNEAGGPSTSLAHMDSTSGAGWGHPRAIPGGRGFFFEVCSSNCLTSSIYVFDLRTKTGRKLVDDAMQATWLPGGRILYVLNNGVAMVAPFDLNRLAITGPATPVLENVLVVPDNAWAQLAFSVSGSLVYLHGRGATETEVMRVARDGTATPVDSAWKGPFTNFDISPDGREMAVGAGRGNNVNIWIKQLDHGPFTRLTFGNHDRRPVWSPDGKLVAFIRDSAATSAAYAKPADGSGPARLLARLHRVVQEVVWSPDGRWLVLRTDNTAPGAGDLVGIRTQGDSTPVPLVATPFSEFFPAVSPDSRWLAYASNESGNPEVYVRPFPKTRAARWQVSVGGGTSPAWSPDGRELYYIAPPGRLVAARVRGGADGFTVEGRTPLFSVTQYTLDPFGAGYRVSRDGRSFYFLEMAAGAGRRQPEMVWADHWLASLGK